MLAAGGRAGSQERDAQRGETCWARSGYRWLINPTDGRAYRARCDQWQCDRCAMDKRQVAQLVCLDGLQQAFASGRRVVHLVLTSGPDCDGAKHVPTFTAAVDRFMNRLRRRGLHGPYFRALEVTPKRAYLHAHIAILTPDRLPMSPTKDGLHPAKRRGAADIARQNNGEPWLMTPLAKMAYESGLGGIVWAREVRADGAELVSDYFCSGQKEGHNYETESLRKALETMAVEVTKGQGHTIQQGPMRGHTNNGDEVWVAAFTMGVYGATRVRPFVPSTGWPGGTLTARAEAVAAAKAKLRAEKVGKEQATGDWWSVSHAELAWVLKRLEDGLTIKQVAQLLEGARRKRETVLPLFQPDELPAAA